VTGEKEILLSKKIHAVPLAILFLFFLIVFYFFEFSGANHFKEESIYFRHLNIVLPALGMVVLIEVGTRIMAYIHGDPKKLYTDSKNKNSK